MEARRIHQLSSVVAARLVSLSADTGDRVRAGQQVGQPLAGVIERIKPTADSLTEELNAKVRLQPGALAGAGFSPLLGELAEVWVALPASRDALAIPAQSLRRRGTELGVWQVGRNGLVFAPLQLGRQDGSGQVEVLAGLQPGAQVVLQPPADPAALRRYRLQEAKP